MSRITVEKLKKTHPQTRSRTYLHANKRNYITVKHIIIAYFLIPRVQIQLQAVFLTNKKKKKQFSLDSQVVTNLKWVSGNVLESEGDRRGINHITRRVQFDLSKYGTKVQYTLIHERRSLPSG